MKPPGVTWGQIVDWLTGSGLADHIELPAEPMQRMAARESCMAAGRFAALVAAHEREECAKLAGETIEHGAPDTPDCETHAYNAAAAIRARSQP